MEGYEPLAPIAKSYYGELSLCVDPQGHVVMARRLALGADADADSRRRIVVCARNARGELHELVVPMIDVLERGGITLVSEYVEGAPLSTLARVLTTRKDAPDPGVLVRIVLDALDGLEAIADEENYTPGGFTPDAVFVCADGRGRLVEPMVQSVLGSLRSLSRHQNRVAYRAPEQFDERVAADGRVDVFTFGVMLFELLHRRRLFAGLGFDDIAKRVRGAKIPPLEGHGKLQEVLATSLARDPRMRFGSVQALRSALADAGGNTEHTAVAALYEELIGSHPSIQRVREAVADRLGGARAERGKWSARPTFDSRPGRDDERTSAPSAIPADSIPPPSVPTAQTLEERGPERQIGRGELFMEIASNDVFTVHVGRWLGAAGFARLIAVTMLRSERASNRKLVAAYLADARVISRVRHPNLVPVHDILDDEGELLVVTDYVIGVTLAHLLRQLKRRGELMPLGVASRIVSDVLYGLHAAHAAADEGGAPSPVIHRNVCPQTVLVGHDGLTRIAHFGVERGLVESSVARAREPFYQAPEQLVGEAVDARTDIYGISTVAYHVYAGRQPFRGEQATEKILEGKPRPPTAQREALPPKLEAIVLRGMARARGERWVSADAMAEALDDLPGMASHRTVAEWVREVAAERLDRSKRLAHAVENAAVMLSADELGDPLSFEAAPRESIVDAMQWAADVFGGASDKPREPDSAPPEQGAPPVASAVPVTADAPRPTPGAAAAPSRWRMVLAVVAAVLVGVLVIIITYNQGDGSPAAAPPPVEPSSPEVPAASTVEPPPVAPASAPEPTPSSEPSGEPSAEPVPVPSMRSSYTWPLPKASSAPVPTPSTAPSRRLPKGI